jgi:hypothetical protein
MTVESKLEPIITGMTDAELECACKVEPDNGSFWHDWTAEIYSFGKCFRYMANYPNILPLFVKSDHGVGLESGLFPHEAKGKNKVYFTWNPLKDSRYNDCQDLQVIRIQHPWIYYRKALAKTRSAKTIGTIVFFTHYAPGVKWVGHDSDEYFSQLRSLPDKFQPIVLCLHMHDINAGHHKELRRHGFPMVTGGNTSSTKFVDRFYDLIKDYSYASSQDWGSQVAYCTELGLPYFFLGKRPKLMNISHAQMPLGEVTHQDEFHAKMEEQALSLFRSPVDAVTPEQLAFVESLLGLDSKVTPERVAQILWREFFRHYLQWPLLLKPMLVTFLHKVGYLDLVKKNLRYFSKGKS